MPIQAHRRPFIFPRSLRLIITQQRIIFKPMKSAQGPLVQLSSLAGKYPSRQPSTDELTFLVSVIEGLHAQMYDIEEREPIMRALQGVLKVAGCRRAPDRTIREVNERMELVRVVAGVVLRYSREIWGSGAIERAIDFMLGLFATVVQQAKPKIIQELLQEVSSTRECSHLLTSSNWKLPLRHCLPVLLLQSLHQHHPRPHPFLLAHAQNRLHCKPSQLQHYIKSLAQMCGNLKYYLAYQVLQAVMEGYVRGFLEGYARAGRDMGGVGEVRVVGVMVGVVGAWRDGAVLRETQAENDEGEEWNRQNKESKEDKRDSLQDRSAPCNFCGGKLHDLTRPLLLDTRSQLYTLHCCRDCSALPPGQLLLQLALSPLPQPNPNAPALLSCLNLPAVNHHPPNSQLKLISHSLLVAGLAELTLGPVYNQLCSVLMLLTNHNEATVRGKALKVIGSGWRGVVGSELRDKMRMFVGKRLRDTDNRVRLAAVLAAMAMEEGLGVLAVVGTEVLAQGGIGSVLASKDIGEVVDKVHQKMAAHIAEQPTITPQAFLMIINTLAKLLTLHAQQSGKQTRLRARSKKTRRSKSLLQLLDQGTTINLQPISKLKSIFKSLGKNLTKQKSKQNQVLMQLIYPSAVQQQKVYDCAVQIVQQMCGWNFSLLTEDTFERILDMVCSSLQSYPQPLTSILSRLEICLANPVLGPLMASAGSQHLACTLLSLIPTLSLTQPLPHLISLLRLLLSLSPLLQCLPVSTKPALSQLWRTMVQQLLPATTPCLLAHSQSDISVICRVIAWVDQQLGDITPTVAVFENCCRFVTEADQEQELSVLVHSLDIVVHLVPWVGGTQLETLGRVHARVIGVVESVLVAESEDMLIRQLTIILTKLWQINLQYFIADQTLFNTLGALSPQVGEICLSAMYHLLRQHTQVSRLQKLRDIFMGVVTGVENKPQYGHLLAASQLFMVIKELVGKGLLTYLHVNKILIYGLVRNESVDQQQSDACMGMCRQALADQVASRQLLSNFNQSLKFAICKRSLIQGHRAYFLLDSLTHAPDRLPSKSELSAEALRPSLPKCLTQLLNKMTVTGRLVSPTPELHCQLALICNTLIMCKTMPLHEYTNVMNCLIAVLEYVYLEVLALVRRGEGNDCGPCLYQVLKVAGRLGQGVPAKKAVQDPEKYCKVSNYVVHIEENEVVTRVVYDGQRSLQYLHEVFVFGFSKELQTKRVAQASGDQSEDSETFDTNQRQYKPKNKGGRSKNKATKPRVGKKDAQQSESIQTKKHIRRSTTTPKPSKAEDMRASEIVQEEDSQVIQYKRKLRNRAKLF